MTNNKDITIKRSGVEILCPTECAYIKEGNIVTLNNGVRFNIKTKKYHATDIWKVLFKEEDGLQFRKTIEHQWMKDFIKSYKEEHSNYPYKMENEDITLNAKQYWAKESVINRWIQQKYKGIELDLNNELIASDSDDFYKCSDVHKFYFNNENAWKFHRVLKKKWMQEHLNSLCQLKIKLSSSEVLVPQWSTYSDGVPKDILSNFVKVKIGISNLKQYSEYWVNEATIIVWTSRYNPLLSLELQEARIDIEKKIAIANDRKNRWIEERRKSIESSKSVSKIFSRMALEHKYNPYHVYTTGWSAILKHAFRIRPRDFKGGLNIETVRDVLDMHSIVFLTGVQKKVIEKLNKHRNVTPDTLERAIEKCVGMVREELSSIGIDTKLKLNDASNIQLPEIKSMLVKDL